ncbi:MAG TPA: Gfo/Idh/MocA family oxidoreductase [Chthonomonadaceae bacterium]|nr:Gfo/Idh/MocA family oxidoreductase [Chthonomonadaceae bacterium]
MKRLNVAIVGCGIISGAHIQGWQRNRERARIVACCDTSIERARKAAEAAGESEARAVTDYGALLADPEIDAVDLCLPHHLHAEMAIAAARAGKHILCEKPLALTPEDCDRMMAAARAAGVILMHGENMRTAENAERAAETIRAGRLGTIVGLQATYAHWQREELNKDWRTRPAESGGGHLIDGAIHFVDVLRHLGGEITAVQAMTTQFRPELGPQSEDTGVLNFRYAGGYLGQMFATHASRGRGASPMLTVFGTEGCLSLDAFGGDRAVILFPHGSPPEVLLQKHHWQDTFLREITHFLDVVQKGEPLRATPEDARENLRVVLAAYESASTGREISL